MLLNILLVFVISLLVYYSFLKKKIVYNQSWQKFSTASLQTTYFSVAASPLFFNS